MRYLIAYDIADPRRLRRVARLLEKRALRCQKSVFFAEVTPNQLQQILDEVEQLIDGRADCLQAWRLAADQPAEGQARGCCPPLLPATVVHDGHHTYLIKGDGP